METASPRLRLSMVAVVVVSLFGALFARMWYLQVMVANRYQLQASADRVRTIQIEAPRGLIYDDQHRVLVRNRSSLVVTMDPVALAKLDKRQTDDLELRVATRLTDAGVPTKVDQIKADLVDKNVNHLQPIPIAIDVPNDLELYFAERASEYPSVAVDRESVRDYPYKSLAANVLGYVGRISDSELKAKQGGVTPTRTIAKPYQPNSEIGKTGVEAAYEDDLRGTPGIERVEVDPSGRPVQVLSVTPPIPGDDVELTLDINAQRSAETALAQELLIRRGKTEGGNVLAAPAGSVVALDPRNGAVRAMATFPTYDPSDFVNGISSDEYAQLTQNGAANNPLINRATQGQYAPGSTFKLVTATAALANGLITSDTWYDDTGGFTTPNCSGTYCFKRNSGGEVLGEVNLPLALTKSSDAYFYRLGYEFWRGASPHADQDLHDMAVAYGFAKLTGIPIGNESIGLMPDRKVYAQLHHDYPKAYPDPVFHPGQAEDAAIGQGVLVTPLQLANAYNTFANHGTVYEPQVVAKILKPGGNPAKPADVVRTVTPVVRGHVSLPPNVYDPIMQGLQGVVSQPGGTATAAFRGFNLAATPLAGKTGTAQVTGKGDTSLFASFGPVGNPQYTIVAVLEESGFGADAAAPVVRHVWETVTGQQSTQVTDQQTGVFG